MKMSVLDKKGKMKFRVGFKMTEQEFLET